MSISDYFVRSNQQNPRNVRALEEEIETQRLGLLVLRGKGTKGSPTEKYVRKRETEIQKLEQKLVKLKRTK